MNMKLTVLVLAVAAASAQANIISTTAGGTAEIGARIRWGNTGFEASVYDRDPFGQQPTLNPAGTPVWGLGNPYQFRVDFSSVTGTLTLSVDFNRDNSFGAGEVISRTTFLAPPRTSYLGYGFNYLSISGNEGGSTARSQLSNLVINGTSLSGMAPLGTFLQNFYKDQSGNPIASIAITGDLTFLTSGTSQERPSWDFDLRTSAPPIPAPGAALLGVIGLGLVGWAKRRFS